MNVLKHKKIYFVIAGTLLFNYLFWQAPFGVNALLFSVFGVASLLILYPETRKSKITLLGMLGHFITALFVVIHNSGVAILGWHFTFILVVGFANQPAIRSILYALPTSIGNFFKFPVVIGREIPQIKVSLPKIKTGWRFIKLALIPLFILLIFYWIFKLANPIFNEFTTSIFIQISLALERFFENVSLVRVLFLLFGFTLSGWIIYRYNITHFIDIELKRSDSIRRIKKTRKKDIHPIDNCEYPARFNFNMRSSYLSMKLKSEYRAAIMLIFSVNFLLLIVNGIDINWIWFNFKYDPGFNLKQFVHEGTYLLILSILLSMAILLFYFRLNLNFYPKQKFLKVLSYIWLAQNGILAFSVALRNYHYINHYGLAYKRIGVIVFLILTIFGLITLYVKIKGRKSTFFLWRTNTWAVYVMLILLTSVNWDMVIARHNLAHNYKSPIDWSFLLSLSDKTLLLLDENSKTLEQYSFKTIYKNRRNFTYGEYFEFRKQNFFERKKGEGWQSWNLAEHKAMEYFKGKSFNNSN